MNNYLKKIERLIVDPNARACYLNRFGLCNWMDDESFLKKQFNYMMGYELDLENPRTFNEKLQWLKIHNRKPEYTMMVDKYAVRQYIADTIGAEYLIPLLGVWDSPEQINFDDLPQQFVLKCNHNSGLGMCICKDKSSLDLEKVKKELKKGLQQDYYSTSREWPYKNVKRKIVCEQYMKDGKSDELMDFKFMCFNGKVQCVFTCTDRFSSDGLKVTFFDCDWKKLPFERHYPASSKPIAPPSNLKKMIELAQVLSQNHPFLRVDFYEIEGKIYFGELTFFPGSGYEEFSPFEVDEQLGKLIVLNTKQ